MTSYAVDGVRAATPPADLAAGSVVQVGRNGVIGGSIAALMIGGFLMLAFVVVVMNGANVMTRANDVVDGRDGCCAHCARSCEDERGGGEMNSLVMIVVGAAPVNNVVLIQFLEICF